MMYSILFEGKKIDLPEYSVELATEIEALDNVEGTLKEKLQAMYDFVYKLVGEQTIEVIGTFEDVDPNLLNILFLNIVTTYNKPLEDYNMQQTLKVFDNPQMKKVLDNIDKIVEANKQ